MVIGEGRIVALSTWLIEKQTLLPYPWSISIPLPLRHGGVSVGPRHPWTMQPS